MCASASRVTHAARRLCVGVAPGAFANSSARPCERTRRNRERERGSSATPRRHVQGSLAPTGTTHPQYSVAHNRGRLGCFLDRGDVRRARRQDRVELARHDVAGKPRLERHQEDVGSRIDQRIRRAAGTAGRGRFVERRLPRVPPPAPLALAVADEQEERHRRSRSRSAASSRRPRFCDRPMLPACMTTKRSCRPWARAKALSFAERQHGAESAQL